MTGIEPPARERASARIFLSSLLAASVLILGVNFAMAYLAVKSFNGVEVKSSYAAGKAMPAKLQEAERQQARGWAVDFHVDRRLAGAGEAGAWAEFRDRDGGPLERLVVEARLQHPSDEFLDRSAVLAESAPGRYAGVVASLRPGAWTVELIARRGDETVFVSRNALVIEP